MADLLVKTISGKKINRANTIKIRDEYHEKLHDCFRVNDRWVSIHFNNLHIDASTGEYNFVSKLKPVLVSNTADFKSTSVGMSSKIYGEPFCLYDKDSNNLFYAVDEEQYNSLGLVKCKQSGNFYPKGLSPFKTITKYNREKHDFHYAVTIEKARKAGIPEEKIEDFGLMSSTFRQTGSLRYLFGVEIETSGGVLPKNLANGQLNIDYVYDGSVYSKEGEKYGGGEIVTGILTGDNGINHLKKIANMAEERCLVNPTCGLHVHVGNFKPTDEFVVNSYLLGYYLQQDVFAHLPKKRKFQLDFAGNITGNTNPYCKMLPAISMYDTKTAKSKEDYALTLVENYKNVFRFVSDGFDVDDRYNKNSDHPKGKKCGYDHNSSRYSWLNLVPTVFNTRKNGVKTLEFRSHCETLSFTKIYYWTLFCMAFTKFCEKYTANIIRNKDDDGYPLSLQFILSKSYSGKLLENVSEYFINRKTFFSANDKALESDFTNFNIIK